MATTLLPGEFQSGAVPGRDPVRAAPRCAPAIAPLVAVRGLPRWLFWTGATITLVFLVLAIFAPEIAPYGFNQYMAHRSVPRTSPSFGDPLVGNDDRLRGRLFPFHIQGVHVDRGRRARVFVLRRDRVPLGLISGYFGGWLDRVLVLINDSIFAFPYLLLAIVIAFLLSTSVGAEC